MRRIRIVCFVLVAGLAISATAAATASAARSTLTLSEGGKALAPGAVLSVRSEAGHSIVITTSSGGFECNAGFEASTLGATLVINSKATDELESGTWDGASNTCERGNARFTLRTIDGLKLRSDGDTTSKGSTLELFIEFIKQYTDVTCAYSSKRLTGANTATATREKLEIELEGTLKVERYANGTPERAACPEDAYLKATFSEVVGENDEVVEEQVNG